MADYQQVAKILVSLFTLAPHVLSYPSNMVTNNKRFAYTKDDSLGMSGSSPGTFSPQMINQGSVTCNNKGLYIVGSDVSSSAMTAHGENDAEEARFSLYSRDTDIGTIAVTGSCYDVICGNFARWEYASICNGDVFDIFDLESQGLSVSVEFEKPAVVVGCGVGGLSAARAMVRRSLPAQNLLVLCKEPGASTTDRSTGVMFFPVNTTYNEAYLDEKVPLNQKTGMNKTLMLDWFKNGEASLRFWEADLELQAWSLGGIVPDDYQGVPNPLLKKSCSAAECGRNLTGRLSAGLNLTSAIVSTVTRAPDGRFRVFYLDRVTQQPTLVLASILVIGAGGNGEARYPDSTHAVDNDGLALRVAESLNLVPKGEESCYWLPHYRQNDALPREEWFSLFNCRPDCGAVSGCDPYNARGLAMTEAQCNATAFDPAGCDAQFHLWRGVVNASYALFNMQIPLQDGCANLTYLKGVIDCKGGFEIGPDLASTSNGRLYAAGTSAAAYTADTYISPGATIGKSVYDGWAVSLTAVDRLNAFEKTRLQRLQEGHSVVPVLFAAASWLLLFAVLAHVASSFGWLERQSTLFAYMHYFLATIAVFIFTIAVYRAASSGDDNVPSQHYNLGYIAFVLLWVQLLGGSWLALEWHRNGRGYKLAGLAHRASGVAVVTLVALQYFSAGVDDGVVARLGTDNNSESYFAGAIVWTSLIGLIMMLSLYYYFQRSGFQVSSKAVESVAMRQLL